MRGVFFNMNDKFTGKTAAFQNKLKKGLEALDEVVTGELSGERKALAQRRQLQKQANKKIKSLHIFARDGMGWHLFVCIASAIACIVSIVGDETLFLGGVGNAFGSMSTMFWGLLSLWGAGCFYRHWLRKEQANRITKYYPILESSKDNVFSVEKLAQITSTSPKHICKDIELMLEKEILLGGFLDQANQVIVLENVSEYLDNYAYPDQADPTPFVEQIEHETLREIRKINQNIKNPTLSKQIDHISMITGKILEFQEKNNTKDQELHSFLSYYLPTTLKVLTFYSELESQNIEGDNITKAKQEIEDMMDKVVEGFEKQLDQLFQNETMDIVTDIQVLEKMFEKNGLTSPFSTKKTSEDDHNINLNL